MLQRKSYHSCFFEDRRWENKGESRDTTWEAIVNIQMRDDKEWN